MDSSQTEHHLRVPLQQQPQPTQPPQEVMKPVSPRHKHCHLVLPLVKRVKLYWKRCDQHFLINQEYVVSLVANVTLRGRQDPTWSDG